MDLLIDSAALSLRKSAQTALKVLEAAIEHALGFPVSIQKLQLWASPLLFEESRVPERFVRLTPGMEAIDEKVLAQLEARTPVEQIPSAKEMIRKRRVEGSKKPAG